MNPAKYLLVILVTSAAMLGCGDDPPPPPPPPGPGGAPAGAMPTPPPVETTGFAYPKVEEDYRRDFQARDFVPDPQGEERRDPFRSWVLQPELDDPKDDVEVTDVCTDPRVRWGAKDYSVRDLELVGIVGRTHAQFVDKSDRDSWVVRRNDCLGQEKATVDEIGVGYVRLTVTPEPAPGAPPPTPQQQEIPLYPEELDLPEAMVDEAVNE